MCLDVVDFNGTIVGNSEGNSQPEAQASDAKLVPGKTKKVFVVINPYTSGWDLSKEAVVGKLWSAINTAVDTDISNVATSDNFMMASAGTSDKGALTEVDVYKPGAYTTEAVEAAKKILLLKLLKMMILMQKPVSSDDFVPCVTTMNRCVTMTY